MYQRKCLRQQNGNKKQSVVIELVAALFYSTFFENRGTPHIRSPPYFDLISIPRTGGGAGEGEDAEEETDEEEEEVYVTETGTVYHKDPDCTHIRLSIRSVSKNQLKGIRNVNGGKYHACERCRGGSGDKVYVSPYGDKYHSSLNCSGLKRTVNKVSLSEAEKLRPCSKCGK